MGLLNNAILHFKVSNCRIGYAIVSPIDGIYCTNQLLINLLKIKIKLISISIIYVFFVKFYKYKIIREISFNKK